MTQYIQKLPAVFQTVTEKKFFDATFDQVFSKKDSDLINGYIGRRIPGYYDPVNDFYIPEPSKDRTWWQLEATAFSKNEDGTKSNIFFYDDLLNRINYYGGNTLNQDRLFNSEYYSWAPPIDYDMFMNYHNYYWVEQGLNAINVTGISDGDINSLILGKASFNTSQVTGALPANLQFTTGLKIKFADSVAYPEAVTIENMGGCAGIQFVQTTNDYVPGTPLEFLPWDGTIQLNDGRIIENYLWDALTWDVQPQPLAGDYITIERGSKDRNAWSRTNKWVHISAINETILATGTAFPISAKRALRPIIQFPAELMLYKSGTIYKDNIDFGFRNYNNGNPVLLGQLQYQLKSYIDNLLGIEVSDGQLVIFLNDTQPALSVNTVNQYIFQVSINPSTNIVSFVHYSTPATDGDIIIVDDNAPYDGLKAGQTVYFSDGQWLVVANEKRSNNQPPIFQLFDHNGVPLDDPITYPDSNFFGSKIFSYKVNTTPGAAVDPVLKFPIVYSANSHVPDIVFQNNLLTNRYTYSNDLLAIDGYYYYKFSDSEIKYNNWNLYSPCNCDNIDPPTPYFCNTLSKQRVIDKYVVGYGTEYQFKLSAEPYGYPSAPDIIVSVNDVEIFNNTVQSDGYILQTINNTIYVNLENYLTELMSTVQSVAPVVEIQTYTHESLNPLSPGYFEIPQQLDANPTQEEIYEITSSNLIHQFSSIIENQLDFEGVAFGGINNYRDTRKNRSVGSFILQNTTPVLKSMLISSNEDLDIISGIRFSQDEYTKFKNKYLSTALQLINREFNPVQYHNNSVVISAWVDEIIKTVNISKEFSNAFAYSYMIANGTPYSSEAVVVPPGGLVTLSNYVDLSDLRNSLYAYDVTDSETLLVVGIDYEIISTNLAIDLKFNSSLLNRSIVVALYKNPLPAYIPSTPAKVGTSGTFIPRIELDTSYTPYYKQEIIDNTVVTMSPYPHVIIGHDGSKTMAYSLYDENQVMVKHDYRDDLLLELEKRIYNLLQYKFRHEYSAPVRIEDVKSGYFRNTRYTINEYLDITQSYLNKWAAKNRANYRVNDWDYASQQITNVDSIWKLYNYSRAVTPLGEELNLPGNWKGIFMYLYDTIYPDTKPWEMLGFTAMPEWWISEYSTNWTASNSHLWQDLELGIIRQGPRAVYDPTTLEAQPIEMWARPGLSTLMPVDINGNIRPVLDINNPASSLFNIAYSGNPYEPFDGYNDPWKYGDGAPVEQAWMSTSSYFFSTQEFLFLMRPAAFGELLFDTVGTEISPGTIEIEDIAGPVKTTENYQYVQNAVYTAEDGMFSWMRPRNDRQIVHAETIDDEVKIRFGYQRWISDKILFLGKNVGTEFGRKVRTLNVNLANKFAGFTNKDTAATYIESVSTNTSTTSLLIPSNNFEVILHKGQPVKRYAYSGVIIRALADGTYVVYGYDLLNAEFITLDRSNERLIDITVGGTPAEYKIFTAGETYNNGDIVRYNGVYYLALNTIVASRFDSEDWQKLRALPTQGGVSVTYRPVSLSTTTVVPYGTIFGSVQEVFDFIIGWGAYLETQGWLFDNVDADTNQVYDWLYSAKQYLYWLNTNWAPDASIQISPAANSAKLVVETGYPDNVEGISNGVYSILDKYGVSIPPNGTVVNRDGKMISVEPTDLSVGGIYFLQVTASETEHILIFDNTTNFNDIIYSPLLRERQERIKFNGFRSNNWYGKMEAPGYLVIGNELVPNYDTIVDAMRYYYDSNITIDNPSLEALGRHLIGYESKSYLDNLDVTNDVQYLFYQGAIRQKGTSQTIDKLFRSSNIQTSEEIIVYEEWALKLADFGNTVGQVSTEFIVTPEKNTGNVVVTRLNFIPSSLGFVKEIGILNAETKYTSVPTITISAPDYEPDTYTVFSSTTDYIVGDIVSYEINGNISYFTCTVNCTGIIPTNTEYWALSVETIRAKAYAVLDSKGILSRIDITNPGAGYTKAPTVDIVVGSIVQTVDKAFAVWQGKITKDEAVDNIIEIDIDDGNVWTVRPQDPEYSLTFPTTDVIEYPIPNAGYVHFGDVDWTSFNVTQTAVKWGTDFLNPVESDTVWVAKTFTEDWDVYKMVNINDPLYTANQWKVVENANGDLLLLTDTSIKIVPQLSDVAGSQTDFGNMICLQIKADNKVSGDTNFAVLVAPTADADPQDPWGIPGQYTDENSVVYNSYNLTTLNGVPLTSSEIGVYAEFTDLLLFKTMRSAVVPTGYTYYYDSGDKIWVDKNEHDNWAVYICDLAYATFVLYREQQPLINTQLFESAEIFHNSNHSQIVLLPIYDPFKNILPGIAKQNISYMSMHDPARYNVTGNTRLFNENIIFGPQQVGKLWWDLSEVRYVYYEQPAALDNSETATDNLLYRRDRWGQIFPGSTIDIYEWTESDVPPDEYTGTGTPRSLTDYVQIAISNRFTNTTEVKYYFWVLNPTDKPSVENRTMAALAVSRLLSSPRSQAYSFFAPIQQTSINNSYMLYNVQDTLSYQGNNVQIQYRLTERNDQKHTQWTFIREGDKNSLIPAQYWDKMVDSICGYTKMLPVSNEWDNSITIMSDDAVPVPVGEILEVPDPGLSAAEKYGIAYRPRQGMFVNVFNARKIFVQSANSLLVHIPIRDDNPNWDDGVATDTYWKYVTWYQDGYENAVPTTVFQTLDDAYASLTAGLLSTGAIVEVIDGTADGRFVLYAVTQDSSSSVQSFDKIAIENSAIQLLDTVYTVKNVYGLSVELRELLNAFRTEIFTKNYLTDQNELYFSMLNYVLSEQKNIDWAFKSSYIYVKENNIPLTQNKLFEPNHITDVINYITDSKPYHTQIRDYTSVHTTGDLAYGTASAWMYSNTKLKFGPDPEGSCNPLSIGMPFGDNPFGTYSWGEYTNTSCYKNYKYILDAKTIADNVEQYIQDNIVCTVEMQPASPIPGQYQPLYPYTFNFNDLNLNNPQLIITPQEVISVKAGNKIYIYGKDYYVDYNEATLDYTAYFFENPTSSTLTAMVLWNGGQLMTVDYNSYRSEYAYGIPEQNFVVNVDTKLPVNTAVTTIYNYSVNYANVVFKDGNYYSEITTTGPHGIATGTVITTTGFYPIKYNGTFTIEKIDDYKFLYLLPSNPYTDAQTLGYFTYTPAYTPISAWGDTWDSVDDPLADIIESEGGTSVIPWDMPINIEIIGPTISYKESLGTNTPAEFYRNALADEGMLVNAIPFNTLANENQTVVTVFVDPATHPGGTDILTDPGPGTEPAEIWINGERIEYKVKEIAVDSSGNIIPNTWTLRTVRRGSRGTAPTYHPAGSKVFVEKLNIIPSYGNSASDDAWNTLAIPQIPDTSTEDAPGMYRNIMSTPMGGLWYAQTKEAEFLKSAPGSAIN